MYHWKAKFSGRIRWTGPRGHPASLSDFALTIPGSSRTDTIPPKRR